MGRVLGAAGVACIALLMGVDAIAQTQQRLAGEHCRISGRLAALSSGLEQRVTDDDLGAAEEVFALERAATNLILLNARGRFRSTLDRDNAQAAARAMMARVLRLAERIQTHVWERLDESLPGEPHREHFVAAGLDMYRPLFRRGTPELGQPPRAPEAAYAEMLQRFRDGGGRESDFRRLDPRALAALGTGSLADWVQLADGGIWVTTSGAKHPLLARGQAVRGAGSLKLYKDARGEVLLAIVSNTSGNYKPGVGATESVVRELIDAGRVVEARIIVTTVVPEEPDLIKLLLKARRAPAADVTDRLQAVKERTRPPPPGTLGPTGSGCASQALQ